MRFSVEVPDKVAQQLHLDGADGERCALEVLAVEGYRQGDLSRGQVSELLGLEFNATEAFLKEHRALHTISYEEVIDDSAALERLLLR